MEFNKEKYEIEVFDIDDKKVTIRAFRNRVYVEKPVNQEFQQMNVFVPEIYFHGESINGYD